MTFRELDKDSQNFLIDQLNIQIENRANEEGIYNYEDPTFEEYEEFFDNFDKNYEIGDEGYPQTTVDDDCHPKYQIEFDGNKVILNTYESY